MADNEVMNTAQDDNSVLSNSQVNISAEQLMNMIQLAVNNIITEKITGENGALNQTKHDIIGHLNSKVEQIESEIYSLKIENESLKTVQNKQTIILNDLQTENDNLKMQMKEPMIHANHNEQYSRKSNIRIFGIPSSTDSSQENCKTIVSDLCKSKLGIHIDEGDIDGAHRVGRVRQGSQPIIVRFFARDSKKAVLANRHKLKGSKIVVYDDLTLKNSKLLNRVKNHPQIESAWVINGKIKAKTKGGVRITCDLFTDITLLCQKQNEAATSHSDMEKDFFGEFTFSTPLPANKHSANDMSPDMDTEAT